MTLSTQDAAVVGKSLSYDERPARSWNSRSIRSPLDMSAAAGMYGMSLRQLRGGGLADLIKRLMGRGLSEKQAREAVMRMLEAQQISGRTL